MNAGLHFVQCQREVKLFILPSSGETKIFQSPLLVRDASYKCEKVSYQLQEYINPLHIETLIQGTFLRNKGDNHLPNIEANNLKRPKCYESTSG